LIFESYHITYIFTGFHGFCHFRGARWGMLGKVNNGIDRARGVLPGTGVGLIGTSS